MAAQAGPLISTVGLDRGTAGPSAARRFVEETLRLWSCEQLIEDARLVVSELVTNAATHASSSARVELRLLSGTLRIGVSDRGGGAPEPQPIDVYRPGGRGLLLVSAVAVAWGVEGEAHGKTVWAELSVEQS
jgi:anti-sigma regulatory factor (Ser/Thr protein kinase)